MTICITADVSFGHAVYTQLKKMEVYIEEFEFFKIYFRIKLNKRCFNFLKPTSTERKQN